MKIIKTLELVGDDKIHPTDGTMYYPGASFQMTTETSGFPAHTVLAISGTGMTEPLAFTLEEVEAMCSFLNDLTYNARKDLF